MEDGHVLPPVWAVCPPLSHNHLYSVENGTTVSNVSQCTSSCRTPKPSFQSPTFTFLFCLLFVPPLSTGHIILSALTHSSYLPHKERHSNENVQIEKNRCQTQNQRMNNSSITPNSRTMYRLPKLIIVLLWCF